jgi:hypothetical protein
MNAIFDEMLKNKKIREITYKEYKRMHKKINEFLGFDA